MHQNRSKIVLLLEAIDLIKSTKRQLYDIRSDAFWDDISKKAKAKNCHKNGININKKQKIEKFV